MQSRTTVRNLLLASAALLAVAPGVRAQSAAVRVEEIRLSPEAHVNEIRTLEGVVERLVGRSGDAEPAFYLEDDYGHQILVIPFAETPARGERVSVTGVVSLDAMGDPVITVFEEEGVRQGAPEPSVGPAAGEARTPVASGRDWIRWLLVVLVVGAIAVVGRSVLRRYQDDGERPLVTGRKDVDFATSALWPESEQTFEGRTLRFQRPDPTVRLMSARLEIVGGGDAGEEIRFVEQPGQPVQMMFGRAPGDAHPAVQLKQKTVSRTHAVVRHRHGEWLLENLSMTNPTVLNGEVLGAKERLLTDGDRIEMGEVVFVFHA